jgi:c-di-GMP-binding flagellar brake protein YcgR
MNSEAAYPLVHMRVSCPNCGAQGRLKRKRPPRKDFIAVCPRCREKFLVKINRRRFYRKTAVIPVAYSPFDIDRPDDPRAREGVITNISREGIGVIGTKEDFSPDCHQSGGMLTFLFSLPYIHDLKKVRGEIVKVADHDGTFTMGVKLSDLHRYTQNAIEFFLSL